MPDKLNPLVSVCMPAYNAGDYILDAVNSILQQSYANLELIIVDDGSTDHTRDQLQTLTDPRVTIHWQENSGQCSAANKAFHLSRGTLIKFMDADDLISPGFIESQVRSLADPAHEIAVSSWGRFYNNDLGTFALSKNLMEEDSEPMEWLMRSSEDVQLMMQCAMWLIPRVILTESGLWDESLSLINDFEFFIRVLLHAKRIRFAKAAILYYRSGMQHSLSRLKSRKGADSAFRSISLGTGYLLRQENSARVNKAAADYYKNFTYTFYPLHKDLVAKAEKRVKELGGSRLPFPSGGYTKLLAGIFGWKIAKTIKYLIHNDA